MPWGIAAAAIGVGGDLLSSSEKSSGDKAAAKQDLTGFNYLTNPNTGVTSTANNGQAANNAEAQLLGTQPVSGATSNGFNNYLNSTGYQFQLGQGQQAITGSAAARGILNSGATAKALTNYGQNLASTSFNNYLGQLNTQGAQGLTASGQIGSAGTVGGGNAGVNTASAGNAIGNGTANAAGQLSGDISNNESSLTNFFGSL